MYVYVCIYICDIYISGNAGLCWAENLMSFSFVQICMNKLKITRQSKKGHRVVPQLQKQLARQPIRHGWSCFVGIIGRVGAPANCQDETTRFYTILICWQVWHFCMPERWFRWMFSGFDTEGLPSAVWPGGETEALTRIERHLERKVSTYIRTLHLLYSVLLFKIT